MSYHVKTPILINGSSGFALTHLKLAIRAHTEGLGQLWGLCLHGTPLDTVRKSVTDLGGDPDTLNYFPDLDAALCALPEGPCMVTVPSPIAFHAPDHAKIVRAGKFCFLEKPPTLDPAELERMIITDQTAPIPTHVGFQQIHNPARLEVKQRLAAGEFGQLREVNVLGLWHRNKDYYARNNWAGNISVNGTPVLDSVFGNALSHLFHRALFNACLQNVYCWATARTVRAELYRVNPIPGTDTVFAEASTDNGVLFRFAATHGSAPDDYYESETLICEKAHTTSRFNGPSHIQWADGKHETVEPADCNQDHWLAFRAALLAAGSPPGPRGVSLADCRSYTHLQLAFYAAARHIHTIPSNYLQEDAQSRWMPTLAETCRSFLESGKFPSESALPWASAGGSIALQDVPLEATQVIAQLSL